MRLLNTSTLQLEEFNSSNKPSYAILSHMWTGEEISFDEMCCPTSETWQKAGFAKIKGFCEIAKVHGLSYGWVDGWVNSCRTIQTHHRRQCTTKRAAYAAENGGRRYPAF